MATSILVIVLSMGIFSMAVSAALQVSRALYNYFTRTVNRTVLLEEETNAIKILSYNVLFKNHMLNKRMEALGEIILCHLPDVICFQEVSLEIYSIFEQSEWWNKYSCSVLHETVKSEPFFCIQLSKLPVNSIGFIPFTNFGPRKKISMVEIKVCGGKPLVVATSHLKSPIPGDDQMFSKKRTAQAKAALNLLKNYPNVIFGGDMNWDEDLDGRFPLLDGWVDAWIELRPRESGWTYDTKSNPMSRSPINNPLQKRLDRFLCNLQDFELKKIDMIGTEPIPGLPRVLPNPIDSEVVARVYVDFSAVVTLLLGGALACYGLVLFLKMRKVRSERASSEMRKVAGLAIVSVLCFTSSALVALFTDIPMLYDWNHEHVDGVYTSLLLILYYFIGSSIPSAFVLWVMRELPPAIAVNIVEESRTIAFIHDSSVSIHPQTWAAAASSQNQVSRASPI